MNTPIYDFVTGYAESGIARMHMPGHKGIGALGVERFDLTEIKGADSLYEADGIIAESERNAGGIFGSLCFYSTEGSSLAIRAMVYLTSLYLKKQGRAPRILAARNAHKTFASAVALTDAEVEWLYTESADGYLSAGDLLSSLREYIDTHKRDTLPGALYITSPDYLGNAQDIEGIAKLCHSVGMLLAVDNAHGAYLKFLGSSMHPIDLGADMCCDSAHKTLSALTGTAYLHISPSAPEFFSRNAKSAMALFASTSPSYLMLTSLDLLNKRLDKSYREELVKFIEKLGICKQRLTNHGYNLIGNEPMKIAISAKKYGYLGTELAEKMREHGIECEFADRDFTVLMLTPDGGNPESLADALVSIPKRSPICEIPPKVNASRAAMSIREAILSPAVLLPVRECEGRILADPSVGCPPAVPILFSGEVVTEEAITAFEYYGIEKIKVVENS